MTNVKNINSIVNIRSHLLIIKANTSFTQSLKKIQNSKEADFIFIKKPKTSQMLSVLIMRILGKKFIWIQSFSNPPPPNFFVKFLLLHSDRIVVDSKKDIGKLKSIGISKDKIKYSS